MCAYRLCRPTVVALVATMVWACDEKPSAALKGQTNASLRFYGLVVDQDGAPLPGAKLTYQVDAYPKDWTFETRGRDYDVSTASATSGPDGRFVMDVTGCVLRLKAAERAGYRHFLEEDPHDGAPTTAAYRLIAWGDPWYKPDPEHPAVFVFVKEGVREVSALPSSGGWFSGGAVGPNRWTLNKPGWPKKPSLKDVVYRPPPTTQP